MMMSSDKTDNSIQPSPDLNRALAEAMSVNHPEIAPLVENEPATTSNSSVVLKWSAPSAGRKSKKTVLGIDYSPNQLTLLEVGRSKRPSIMALQVVQFNEPPTTDTLVELLHQFCPTKPRCARLTLTSARAVVRQFNLPPISKRRLRAAAIWKAQKLIPFSLKESDAVFGFKFHNSSQQGWQVTLAAMPRGDVAPILGALQEAQWVPQGVSIAGTHMPPQSRNKSPEGQATTLGLVLWSKSRAAFVVFDKGELRFHYDMGPNLPRDVNSEAALGPDSLREWVESLEKRVSEALEFYIAANPQYDIERIDLYGLGDSIAPCITDWGERFGRPIVVVDPSHIYSQGLPANVGTWVYANTATITAAILAATGTPTVDMSPRTFAITRSRKKVERITRTVFLASVFAVVMWTGFLWMQSSLAAHGAGQMHVQLEDLRKSPVNSQLQQSALELQLIKSMAAAAAVPATRWMPYFKSILGTIPQDARLVSLISETSLGIQPGTQPYPMMRMDGKLLPGERSHALIYAEWFGRMESIAGSGSVKLISDRDIDWKGRRTSVFSIGVAPSTPAGEQTP